MSDTSSLSELARFVGQSRLSADNQLVRQQAITAITARLTPRPAGRKVTELLGVVLALSARTRRMVMPRVAIELDVFSPAGDRAVRVSLPH